MILPLEKQVTSLEVSKRMRELGFPQGSLWVWQEVQVFSEKKIGLFLKGEHHDFIAPAYTVGELGKIWPSHFVSVRTDFDSYRSWSESNVVKAEAQDADTEADARGKMLIHLKENGLI